MDTGAWQVIVRGVTKSWTQLSNWACIHASIVYICQPQSPISSHSPFPPWEPYCAWNYGHIHPMPFTPSIPSDTLRFWTLPMNRSLARWGFLCIFFVCWFLMCSQFNILISVCEYFCSYNLHPIYFLTIFEVKSPMCYQMNWLANQDTFEISSLMQKRT